VSRAQTLLVGAGDRPLGPRPLSTAVVLEVGGAHEAAAERFLDESQPVLVLRQTGDIQLRERHGEVRLHSIDAEDELSAHPTPVWRMGVVLVRAAEGEEHLSLRMRDRRNLI